MGMKRVRKALCFAAVATGVIFSMPAMHAGEAPRSLEFPADSGSLNVRDFGAKGDGKTDDTEAILRAIAATGQSTGYDWFHDKIVYLPDGTYRISAPLLKRYTNGKYASGMLLLGQSREKTILRLADHATGYGDPEKPRAMIFTTSQLLDGAGPYGGNKDYPALGEGNDAYENFVENMTIDVGLKNKGAIGIDFLASNMGALRNLKLVAREGSGLAGISMVRKWAGPAILEHISVTGFEVGIDVSSYSYCMTLNDIHLSGQHVASVRNHLNSLAIQDITIHADGVPAIVNDAPDGLIVLVGGELHGSLPARPLIENKGSIIMHGTSIEGFEAIAAGTSWNSLQGVLTGQGNWKPAADAWKLPVLNAPEAFGEPVKRWVSVAQFGVVEGDDHDSTAAFRKAFASGAATIYIPHGDYAIREPIEVPASVRHIVGMNSSIKAGGEWVKKDDQGMFQIDSPSAAPLLIERLAMRAGMDVFAFEVSALREVVLRDIPTTGRNFLLRKATGGRVFLDNTCCGALHVSGPAQVAARQYDTEGGGVRVYNSGAPVWILGIKTERANLVAQTVAGGRTEVLGGLIYMVEKNPAPGAPAFSLTNASMTASFTDEAWEAGRHFETYLLNEQAEKTTRIGREGFKPRSQGGNGRMVPLLQGGPPAAGNQK